MFNSRFVALALVATLYFAAGGLYRRRALRLNPKRNNLETLLSEELHGLDESILDPVFGVLANGLLLTAISLDIHSWYMAAAVAGWSPFADMHMAEMATYSIVWAIYAAIVVVVGFAMRYQLFRLLGLIGFGVIVLKVFFIDLESLRWLPRMSALAVLGVLLIAVSMLYQRFAGRMQESAAGPQA